ncbi:vacuolar amino acid transporter 3 [Phaffia rhodozyma]|uniref:Vacuolar amino acid transporter 3 n=1 Tax=Phaffia rhodozyma TaxID=264483 RepID=A0A0F7SSQ0_PHARH|nr:vacuolar amino acid transporter 3 [Phaffia rhodozyma]
MSSPGKARPGSFQSSHLYRPSSSGPNSWTNPPLRIPQVPPRLNSPAGPSPSGSANQSAISVGERVAVSSSPVEQSNLGASLNAGLQSATRRFSLASGSGSGSGVTTPTTNAALFAQSANTGTFAPSPTKELPELSLDAIPHEDKVKVLGKHLVSTQDRRQSQSVTPDHGSAFSITPGAAGRGSLYGAQPGESMVGSLAGTEAGSSIHGGDENDFSIPYASQGGDVTHDLYKWAQTHQQSHSLRKARSASFSHPVRDSDGFRGVAQIKEPGGFRRDFIHARARERGEENPRVLRNVIDFLFLYGHFAGEDLNEDDEDDEDDEDSLPTTLPRTQATEETPLLSNSTNSLSKRGKLARSLSRPRKPPGNGIQGTASATEAVFMLLKGFVGTGVLFMGKAFLNGGILFSTVVMLLLGIISLWSFLLLVKTRLIVPGSFGDIGGILYGKWMRIVILSSIALSQIGFVAAYTIFVAQNLEAFILSVSGSKPVDIKWLIFAQMIVFLPLSLVRNLAKLSGTALIADAFILIGLIYIGSNEISTIAKHGISDVELFNPASYSLLIGTSVFAFEGIGLVIPITESMKEPEKFPRVLTGVMIGISILFAGFGVLSYGAYGSHTETVVLSNLPQDHKFVQVVQFLYSVAILLSTPLQLFPATRIMENGLFEKSGKKNPKVKWQKNLFRAASVMGCMLIAWLGSADLDKFVSFIGSFACIPLCYIYPPLLHLRAGSPSRVARILDYALIVFGAIAMVYTTLQTVLMLLA